MLNDRLESWYVSVVALLLLSVTINPAGAEPSGNMAEPAAVIRNYLRAVYARDFTEAYRYVSAEDRRVRDLNQYLRQRGPFNGFALEVARLLAAMVQVEAVPTQLAAARIRITARYEAPDPEKLSRTLARLASLSGEENLGSAVLLDTHRPDAFQMGAFSATAQGGNAGRRSPQGSPRRDKEKPLNRSRALLALKRIRPPVPIRLQTERIAACAGPWRCSGDWWEAETASEENDAPSSDGLAQVEVRHPSWSRDEWDVEFTDGRICRIYWDHRRKQWFLEGIYD